MSETIRNQRQPQMPAGFASSVGMFCEYSDMVEYPGLAAEFRERYRIVTDPAMRRAERSVIGGDYGASSYTTMEQADYLAGCLELEPGRLLLDIGSGSGWPGNYLAASTGCSAVLADPTLEGMAVARQRSLDDRLGTSAVVAYGEALPFRNRVFDAATSSDAFC